jgi:hypothetical protein
MTFAFVIYVNDMLTIHTQIGDQQRLPKVLNLPHDHTYGGGVLVLNLPHDHTYGGGVLDCSRHIMNQNLQQHESNILTISGHDII